MHASAYESFLRDEEDHFWFVGRRAIFRELLRHRIPALGEDARVVDLGCGVGGMLAPLEEFGRVVGTDNDHGSLMWCRKRGLPPVFEAKAFDLPLRDESVDLVTLFDVIEHVREEQEALAECLRILKPGGWMFISGPSYEFLRTHQDFIVQHHRRYTVTRLRNSIARSGFEVTWTTYINFLLFPAIAPLIMLRQFWEWIAPPDKDDSRLNTEIRIPVAYNRLCAWLFASERHLLRSTSLPFGHSLVAIARKPEGA